MANRGRLALLVAGKFDKKQTSMIFDLLEDYARLDVTPYLPRDPAKGGQDESFVDGIVAATGFHAAVDALVTQALDNARNLCQCSWGKHRSPVVSATAGEILRAAGYSVVVVELRMIHPDYGRLLMTILEVPCRSIELDVVTFVSLLLNFFFKDHLYIFVSL